MPNPTGHDRVFIKEGRRHYRRTYSWTEMRIGLVFLCALALVLVWVAWKGAHPDPELFSDGLELLTEAAPSADRGPLPADLAVAGWSEASLSSFDASNLYVKINGREDYYKALGFERLHFLSLVDDEDPAVAVDIEFFDLGSAANALGAYAGERPPEITPEIDDGGMTHLDRNALFMTRGRYYIRAIGAEESPAVRAQLVALRASFEAGVPGETLPWAYALFTGALGMDPGRVSYMAENAFSFEFATEVYAALLDDEETEMFVVATAQADEAAALAARFNEGFRGYGKPAGESGGVAWTKDRYIDTVAGAAAEGTWVIGVRGAPDLASAEGALDTLKQAIVSLPEGIAP